MVSKDSCLELQLQVIHSVLRTIVLKVRAKIKNKSASQQSKSLVLIFFVLASMLSIGKVAHGLSAMETSWSRICCTLPDKRDQEHLRSYSDMIQIRFLIQWAYIIGSSKLRLNGYIFVLTITAAMKNRMTSVLSLNCK